MRATTSKIKTKENQSFYWSSQNSQHFGKQQNGELDEIPDLHDPLSDVSLFLTQKMKQILYRFRLETKWTQKIQDLLCEEIIPDFQAKFPQYRLGVSALRRTWEKMHPYMHWIQNEKNAMNQDGKINLHYLIRENLKNNSFPEDSFELHHQYVHKLAMKIGECIAIVDGEKPRIDHLTKMIWSILRNFFKNSTAAEKSPYSEYDKIDQLILQTVADITVRQPQISQKELEYQTKETIRSLYELPGFSSLDAMHCNIASLLAEKFYPYSSFHHHFRAPQKKSIIEFIQRHISLYKASTTNFEISEFVRRTLSLYALATKLPKNLQKQEIKEAVLSLYPTSKSERPNLDQVVYAFLSAEILLLKNKEYCYSIEYVQQSAIEAYEQASLLPNVDVEEMDMLEMVLWKTISEQEGVLEKLPYLMGQTIEEQIGRIVIENPKQSFKSSLACTMQFFKSVKELALCKKWDDVERKIHNWSLQGEMIYRWMRYNTDSHLIRHIHKYLDRRGDHPNDRSFLSELCQRYLFENPSLGPHLRQLDQQLWIAYKYLWYQNKEESAFQRFLEWHYKDLSPLETEEDVAAHLEEICVTSLPMIAFDPVFMKNKIAKSKIEAC